MPADSQQVQVERGAERQFVEGRSGNPAGRVAGTRNYATVLVEQFFDGARGALARLGFDPSVPIRKFAISPISSSRRRPGPISAVGTGLRRYDEEGKQRSRSNELQYHHTR
jgi:hypothetical protein